jgi:hypothetical protein
MPGFFSDVFDVPASLIEDYGAVDVSLIADLPLFVDPFLLFNSAKPEYQELHDEIVAYLAFLKRRSDAGGVTKGDLMGLYCFSEVKQNWFGYCELGNNGSGLGLDFAKQLHRSLAFIFNDIGSEGVTRGAHLEKVCLIKDGVGRDNISDFATNLIKHYLLSFTQDFAKEYIDKSRRRKFPVRRARFNYKLESWVTETYELPYFDGDFVLLTPRDILTKDETWINQRDMIDRFHDIPASVPNPQLKSEVSNYFYRQLRQVDDEPTAKDRREAAYATLAEYPWLIDFYIKLKEDSGNEAVSVSEEKLMFAQLVFNEAVKTISSALPDDFYAKPPLGTLSEAHARLAYLKHVIEDQGGHRFFYLGGKPLQREADLHVLYRLVWYGTRSDFGAEANDGRGPVDFKVSYGAKDKTLVEFKLAKNRALRKNLEKQVEIYKKASDAQYGIKAIVYFSADELERVQEILFDLKLENDPNVVLIDAREDNKPSGSKAG